MKGHIRRRGPRSWELKFDIERADGRRRTCYKTVRGTKRDAEAELTRLIAQAQEGNAVTPSKIRVGDFVRTRVELWQSEGLVSVRTAERYHDLIRLQVEPLLGGMLLQRLRTVHVEAWHAQLRSAGLSPRTIRLVHQLLARALRDAVRHGLVTRNAAAEQRAPRVTRADIHILSPEQVRSLPTLLAGQSVRAPALVALFTGVRRGELLALRWNNIDWEKAELCVHQALDQTRAHGVRFKQPKTKSGSRRLSLPRVLIDVLREHRRAQLELRMRLGLGRNGDDALVFPCPGSEAPWSPHAFSTAWHTTARRLGLDVSFHALRHTHASQLIAAGVDVVTVSHRLGHASPNVTLGSL